MFLHQICTIIVLNFQFSSQNLIINVNAWNVRIDEQFNQAKYKNYLHQRMRVIKKQHERVNSKIKSTQIVFNIHFLFIQMSNLKLLLKTAAATHSNTQSNIKTLIPWDSLNGNNDYISCLSEIFCPNPYNMHSNACLNFKMCQQILHLKIEYEYEFSWSKLFAILKKVKLITS